MEESISLNWWQLGIGLGVLAILAVVADWMKSRVLAKAVGKVAAETRISLDSGPFDKKVLARLAPIVPALVVYYGIVPALGVTRSEAAAGAEAQVLIIFWTVVRRLSAAYIVLTIARTFVAAADSFSGVYHRTSPASMVKPIKSYVQIVTLIVYSITGVVIVAILLGRAPVVFLSGVGAAAAALMLIFRNTLVSLAASIQITSNDMVRIGDWVEIPHAGADGTVVDIDLHQVKVQNWDKTISTIANHKFINESFKNWRAMSESGGRRIKRAVLIDVNTVRFLSDEEIHELSRRESLHRHLRHEFDGTASRAPEADGCGSTGQVEPVTNLEMFRAYVEGYLRAHPKTHQEMPLMVRHLEPGPHGASIEIYCFLNDTQWHGYEAFQSRLFDHLFAILPEFGLRAFQEWSGSDLPHNKAPVTAE